MKLQPPLGDRSRPHPFAVARRRSTVRTTVYAIEQWRWAEHPLKPVTDMTSVNLPDSGPQVDAIPLSCGQQQLWFLERLRGPSAAYNLTMAVRLKGTLDGIALRSALDDVVSRHESLRTTFREDDGIVTQQVVPSTAARVSLRVEPVAPEDLTRRLAEAAGRTFALERGLPWRAHLFALAADEHVCCSWCTTSWRMAGRCAGCSSGISREPTRRPQHLAPSPDRLWPCGAAVIARPRHRSYAEFSTDT
ncbi:MAG: condensation domain-containing protein [Vicinamibacterales bacterium]